VKRKPATETMAHARALEISYRFGFDAAHHFNTMPRGHRYRSVHGHSFRVEITVRGQQQAPNGFVTDFAKLDRACKQLHKKLDHTLLNDIPGLQKPSLENICVWLWDQLHPKFPRLARVTVRRDSLGQACTYAGDHQTA
jgi:6-pyruvoyltetrahydropterin/6-carboxytetrahydropterin synthase